MIPASYSPNGVRSTSRSAGSSHNWRSRSFRMSRGIGLAGITKWKACLIESNLHLKDINQRGIVLGGSQLPGVLRHFYRFGKSPDLGISRRQRADKYWVRAAGKPDRWFGQFDCFA